MGVRLPDRTPPGADRPAGAADRGGRAGARARSPTPRCVAHVDPAAKILPTRVTGRLPGTPPGHDARPRGGGERPHPRRRAQLPPARAARPSSSRCWCRSRPCGRGRNALEVLEVRPGGGLARRALGLRRVGDLARVAVEPASASCRTSMKKQVEALAVVVRDAAAVVAVRVARACPRPRGCGAARRRREPRRSPPAAWRPRSRWSVSTTIVGRLARPAASMPKTPATSRPVPMRSESTSSWALAGAPGLGRGAALPHAARRARGRPRRPGSRLPNVASRSAGIKSMPSRTGDR